MVAVERFTGVRITPELIAGLERMHLIVPVLEDLRSARLDYPHRSVDRDLFDAITALPPDGLRRLASSVAAEAVVATGLGDIPAVARTLASMEGDAAVVASLEFEEVVRRIVADASRVRDHDPLVNPGHGIASYHPPGPETRAAWKRSAAAQTLRAATNPDALAAALDAIQYAHFVFPEDPAFLERVRRMLP